MNQALLTTGQPNSQACFAPNLFLLHRANEAFLRGETRMLNNSRLTRRERLLLRLVIIMTIVTAVLAVYLSIQSLRLTQQGVITRAEIVEHGTRFNIPGISFYVIYRFEAGGQSYTAGQAVSESIYRRLSRLDAVAEIAYLPDNPAVSRLAGDNQIYTETSMSIFSVLVGLLITAAIFIRPYRTRRLARHGRVLMGEIKTHRYDRAHIHVRFTFRSPEGRRLEGVGSARVHDTNHITPEPGVPCAVLYHNENFYRIL
jgi:hypothetical protein